MMMKEDEHVIWNNLFHNLILFTAQWKWYTIHPLWGRQQTNKLGIRPCRRWSIRSGIRWHCADQLQEFSFSSYAPDCRHLYIFHSKSTFTQQIFHLPWEGCAWVRWWSAPKQITDNSCGEAECIEGFEVNSRCLVQGRLHVLILDQKQLQQCSCFVFNNVHVLYSTVFMLCMF